MSGIVKQMDESAKLDKQEQPSSLAAPTGWDAAHQLDIYLEALRNLETAQGHARLGHFDSAAFNCRMAAEKFFAIYEARQRPNAELSDWAAENQKP